MSLVLSEVRAVSASDQLRLFGIASQALLDDLREHVVHVVRMALSKLDVVDLTRQFFLLLDRVGSVNVLVFSFVL